MDGFVLEKFNQPCFKADYTLSEGERLDMAKNAFELGLFDAARTLAASLRQSEEKLFLLAKICEATNDYAGARRNLYDSARKYSSVRARKELDDLCLRLSNEGKKVKEGKLCDFSGKEIFFDRRNIPVCGRIAEEDDHTLFEISLNVVERRLSDMKIEKPSRAIVQGIKQWQGKYLVFGGYPVEVKISCTYELKKKNSLIINIIDDDTANSVTGILSKLGKRGRRNAEIITDRRQSAAMFGAGWKLSGLKYINIFEEDLKDIKKCRFLLRHELGHILGLDDMYAEKEDGREGVKQRIADIEMFRIRGELFNMVMCSVDAPVCFKDIEMALLAYRDDEVQRFQKRFDKGEISAALTAGIEFSGK